MVRQPDSLKTDRSFMLLEGSYALMRLCCDGDDDYKKMQFVESFHPGLAFCIILCQSKDEQVNNLILHKTLRQHDARLIVYGIQNRLRLSSEGKRPITTGFRSSEKDLCFVIRSF